MPRDLWYHMHHDLNLPHFQQPFLYPESLVTWKKGAQTKDSHDQVIVATRVNAAGIQWVSQQVLSSQCRGARQEGGTQRKRMGRADTNEASMESGREQGKHGEQTWTRWAWRADANKASRREPRKQGGQHRWGEANTSRANTREQGAQHMGGELDAYGINSLGLSTW